MRRELLGRDPDAGDEVVKEFVEQESKRRIEIYVRNEEARRSKKQHNFNKGTLRSVLEEVADDQSQNEPYDGQQGNQAAQPKANRVPASVALDSREFYKYVVYLSEPHRRSDEHLVFKSTKDFGRLDDAHSYLNDVLLDRKPPNASRKSKMEQEFDSLHFARFDDGLPWGEKKLRGGSASGKWITAYVQQVKQMRGNLEPDTLRNMYADKEMVDKFTPLVYQVTLVRIYPKMFKEAEEKREYLRQRRERKFKRQQEKFEKAAARQALDPVNEAEESAEQPAAAEMDEAGEGGRPGLTGEDVREKLADGGWSGGGPNSEDDASSDGSSSDESTRASDDGNQSDDDDHSKIRNPRDDYTISSLKSYTTRDLAKKSALKVAREMWKPQRPDVDAWAHYKTNVLPYLAEQEEHSGSEDEELVLKFPECLRRGGQAACRIWGFTDSQVLVSEMKLKGPVDLDIGFVQNANDAFGVRNVRKAVELIDKEHEQTKKLADLRRALNLQAQEPAMAVESEGEEVDESGDEQSDDLSEESEEE